MQEDTPPTPTFTRELFLEWRSPRPGKSNPERLTNPVWEWLIETKLNAYQATQQFQGPSAREAGPGWCFDRYGQSSTTLADGRIIQIAGEHEDHYDPDFYIYNDVVVRHLDGKMDIFGYPPEAFPPTDFHSATLAGNRIIIIGNLGYQEDPKPGQTPVFVLNLDDFSVAPVQTIGTPPGWIYEQGAALSEDGLSIIVQKGKLDRGDPARFLVENIDDWRLHLSDWRWERLTERGWKRWAVHRQDQKPNHLWEFETATWAKKFGEFDHLLKDLGPAKDLLSTPPLAEKLGTQPDLDTFGRLYQPAVPHHELPPREDEYGIHRIEIDGVIVRYVTDMHSIQITVEGTLPDETTRALVTDLREKLATVENTPCELTEIQ